MFFTPYLITDGFESEFLVQTNAKLFSHPLHDRANTNAHTIYLCTSTEKYQSFAASALKQIFTGRKREIERENERENKKIQVII